MLKHLHMSSVSDIFTRNTHEPSYAIAWLHLKGKTYLLRCRRGKEWVCADALGNGTTDAYISAVEERFLWSLAHPLLPRYRVHAPAVRCKHGETLVTHGTTYEKWIWRKLLYKGWPKWYLFSWRKWYMNLVQWIRHLLQMKFSVHTAVKRSPMLFNAFIWYLRRRYLKS